MQPWKAFALRVRHTRRPGGRPGPGGGAAHRGRQGAGRAGGRTCWRDGDAVGQHWAAVSGWPSTLTFLTIEKEQEEHKWSNRKIKTPNQNICHNGRTLSLRSINFLGCATPHKKWWEGPCIKGKGESRKKNAPKPRHPSINVSGDNPPKYRSGMEWQKSCFFE